MEKRTELVRRRYDIVCTVVSMKTEVGLTVAVKDCDKWVQSLVEAACQRQVLSPYSQLHE